MATDFLQTALDALHQYQTTDEDADASDKKTIAEVISKILSLQAEDQKENEAAMGVTPAHKAMARQSKAASRAMEAMSPPGMGGGMMPGGAFGG